MTIPAVTRTLVDMPLFPHSPVPPADGIVTDERLAALLRLAAEYDELDFKAAVDLSSTRGEVEMAKDVGAMQVKGGYIVIGIDDSGEPTGAMDGGQIVYTVRHVGDADYRRGNRSRRQHLREQRIRGALL